MSASISKNSSEFSTVTCRWQFMKGWSKSRMTFWRQLPTSQTIFHTTVTMLSAPLVNALLDHMCARHAGSHSFLAAGRCGTTLMSMESFLENGPAKLLQSFFDRLPDHHIDIERGSTHQTNLEMEVNHLSRML